MNLGTQAIRIARALQIALIGTLGMVLCACGMTPQDEAEAVERGILQTPGAEKLWAAIKAEYPEDFAILVERIRNASPAELADAARAEAIGAQWLREFFDRISADSVKAPAAEMIAWSAAEHELYAALQRSSVPDCAAMTMGEWIFIEDSGSATAAAIARRNEAMVRAAAAGRDDPQNYAEPDDGAFGVLGDAIAATGIDPELQANLGSDQAMAALSAEQQCNLGVAVYKGLSAMPDDLEPQMAAYMLAPQ
ncbi:hypothetical protein [Qipengyuania sp. ASV99]|uniref:hypothetical protein n=1 Tax=Qipengyuania sp. ASV99 TaxID=3399681 RepID=UPI003A4C79EB